MRIAFSGSHRVGKSTLVAALADALPGYTCVDEPYVLLEEEGHEFADPPTVEDFAAQLQRSLVALADDAPDALFDRAPVDLLAYVLEVGEASAVDADDWAERTRDAMRGLELIVFVPIEARDRIPLAAHEDAALRRAVDERLHQLLVDDVLGLEVPVVIVHGDVAARVAQVLARVASAG